MFIQDSFMSLHVRVCREQFSRLHRAGRMYHYAVACSVDARLLSRRHSPDSLRRIFVGRISVGKKMARRKFAVYTELKHAIKRSTKLFVKLTCVANSYTYFPLNVI